jgi:hypothetical protein
MGGQRRQHMNEMQAEALIDILASINESLQVLIEGVDQVSTEIRVLSSKT